MERARTKKPSWSMEPVFSKGAQSEHQTIDKYTTEASVTTTSQVLFKPLHHQVPTILCTSRGTVPLFTPNHSLECRCDYATSIAFVPAGNRLQIRADAGLDNSATLPRLASHVALQSLTGLFLASCRGLLVTKPSPRTRP